MSAHPIMIHALGQFAPARTPDARTLRRMVERRDAAWNSLLRLPFEIDLQTRAADRNGPAEYATAYAHEDDVRDAVDALIDKYIVELEADVTRRRALRIASGNQP